MDISFVKWDSCAEANLRFSNSMVKWKLICVPIAYECSVVLLTLFLFPELAFLTVPTEKKTICSLELTDDQVDAFKEAVANTYWFEFFVGMVLHLETDSNRFVCILLALAST
jgi:hypothetical protein